MENIGNNQNLVLHGRQRETNQDWTGLTSCVAPAACEVYLFVLLIFLFY